MKVLNFLELQFTDIKTRQDFTELFEILYEDKVKHFYSQLFKPELITELFEGWRKTKGIDAFIHDKGDDRITLNFFINKFQNCWTCQKLSGTTLNDTINFPFAPKTLDRFIYHCQDAGIELIWRAK